MLKTLFFSIWLLFHPVHVTITSIDFIPVQSCFNVFVKLYLDDFLLDLRLNGADVDKDEFSAGTPASKEVMEKYLGRTLLIRVNEKLLSGKILDMKVEDNEISMNLEYTSLKRPKTIVVQNLIMTKLYSDQSNMIIVRVDDFEEGVKLTTDLTERTFKIK